MNITLLHYLMTIAVLATYLAHQLGYKKAILLGVDCWGTHYFGPHPSPLKNTKPHRFQVFQKQFATAKEKLSDMEIVNCSEGTALTTIPVSTLQKEGILE